MLRGCARAPKEIDDLDYTDPQKYCAQVGYAVRDNLDVALDKVILDLAQPEVRSYFASIELDETRPTVITQAMRKLAGATQGRGRPKKGSIATPLEGAKTTTKLLGVTLENFIIASRAAAAAIQLDASQPAEAPLIAKALVGMNWKC